MLAWFQDPNFMYVLFLLGIYGIFFEIYNPGLLIPGITGGIFLILALYAFQFFPTNYAGLALLVLGLVLMIIEIFVGSYGIIALPGILAFAAGSLFLFDSGQTNVHLSWKIIVLMVLVTLVFFFMAINLGIRAMKRRQVMGELNLVGKIGEVLTVREKDYQIRISGEIWNAQSEQTLHAGDKVQVLSVDGMLLTVTRADCAS